MRFVTLAFANGVVAQLTLLTPVITKIVSDVGALGTAINAYTGGDGAAVLSAGKMLLDDINAGVTTAKGSAALSQEDALALTTPIQGLQTATEGVIRDLTAKKCSFASSGKATDVLTNLQDQLTASKALADAITSKVPSALQPIAATLSSGIATALQGGVDSFKDTSSCPAAPGGGSSSSAAPTSGSSSSASAAPTSGGSGTFTCHLSQRHSTNVSIAAPSSSAKPTVSAPPSNSTVSTVKPSSYTGAASAANSVPAYAGVVVVAALFGVAF